MATVNDLFDQKLRKLIGEHADGLRRQATQAIVTDMASHNYLLGRIYGLGEVLALCDEVQTELSKR